MQMIITKQQMNSYEYKNTFKSKNDEKVKIGNYSFNVHQTKDEIDSEFWFDAFPDGFDKKLIGMPIDEQIKNYRYIDKDICVKFFKDTHGNISCNTPQNILEDLWQKSNEITGEKFESYRMQNILVDKNGVVIGFSGESEFSIGYEMLYINKSVCNTWETSDNNGAGYKTTTYYLELALIRNPQTYEL